MSKLSQENWLRSKWRPVMGWTYMAICIFDFILAPILWSILQAVFQGAINEQWQPLTLQGAGLFHISMGAVLGIAAYGRTKEKLNGFIDVGEDPIDIGLSSMGPVGTTYQPPSEIIRSPGITFGYKGKKAPVLEEQPPI
jgi:hypothetical protein